MTVEEGPEGNTISSLEFGACKVSGFGKACGGVEVQGIAFTLKHKEIVREYEITRIGGHTIHRVHILW